MYVLVTCKHYKDHPQTAVKMWRHHHFHYKAMWVFFRLSRAVNSVPGGPIGPKIELVQDIMYVPITCKFKKDWLNSYQEKVETLIFRRSMAANSAAGCQILTQYELIQACMHVLITCKYHKYWIRNSRENSVLM